MNLDSPGIFASWRSRTYERRIRQIYPEVRVREIERPASQRGWLVLFAERTVGGFAVVGKFDWPSYDDVKDYLDRARRLALRADHEWREEQERRQREEDKGTDVPDEIMPVLEQQARGLKPWLDQADWSNAPWRGSHSLNATQGTHAPAVVIKKFDEETGRFDSGYAPSEAEINKAEAA